MYPYFHVLGHTVRSYALCGFIGLFAAVLVGWRLLRRVERRFEDAMLMTVAVGVGLLVGGHLFYGVTRLPAIVADAGALVAQGKAGTLTFSQLAAAVQNGFGGMVFYGGFGGALAGVWVYRRCERDLSWAVLTDILAICVPLFHAFGRIGCFLGGCCYGQESRWGFVAQNALVPGLSGVRRFPVALAESLFCLVLFAVLWRLFRHGRCCGELLYVYLCGYPVGRFGLEFLRGDAVRGGFWGLSTSQWVSLALLAVGIGHFVAKRFRMKIRAKKFRKNEIAMKKINR